MSTVTILHRKVRNLTFVNHVSKRTWFQEAIRKLTSANAVERNLFRS